MKKITNFLLMMVASIAIASCSSAFDEPKEENSKLPYSCKATIKARKVGFDNVAGTRASSEWENGNVIYLLFSSGSKLVYGDATYEDGEWTVNYSGDLVRDSTTTVKAYYFEDNGTVSNGSISLSEKTAIYEDLNGTYSITDGSLSITATLKPKTGRLRFKGDDEDCFKFYGITYHTNFNRYTGEYTVSKGVIDATVDSVATPFYYGAFTDSIQPRLNIWKASEGFTRIFPDTIFKTGESGFINIPTSKTHDGWANNVTFKVKDVEFTMIPVEYSGGNFLMAQTETTEALYEAVMNDGKVSQLPKDGISYNAWQNFIKNLNSKLSLSFSIPSYLQWEYAAKGGNKSQGYTYSGSNNIEEVAWYEENSGNGKHEVATKQPNELGFYDMSGNVWEYVYNDSNYYFKYYGGSYVSDHKSCTVSSSDESRLDVASAGVGLRFIMDNK